MHAQFLHQFPLAGDAVQIADQQNAQQQLGINRRSASVAVTFFQLLAHEGKTDVPIDKPQQVRLWNLIVQSEVIEQRFGAVVLPHHDQQSSDNENPTEHGSDHFLLTCFRQSHPANRGDFFNTHAM